MCVFPVTHCVSCVPVQAHNGQLTASCVGMLHASQRGVWRAATLLQVRRQMFFSGKKLRTIHQNSCFSVMVALQKPDLSSEVSLN